MDLDPRLKQTYERDGIVHLPGAFRDWADPLLAALDRVIEKGQDPNYPGDPDPVRPAESAPRLAGRGRRGHRRYDGAERRRARSGVRDWIWHSPAAELVGRITASRVVRYWTDACFIKHGCADDVARCTTTTVPGRSPARNCRSCGSRSATSVPKMRRW